MSLVDDLKRLYGLPVNNMNPAVMGQMAAQAEPEPPDMSGAVLLPPDETLQNMPVQELTGITEIPMALPPAPETPEMPPEEIPQEIEPMPQQGPIDPNMGTEDYLRAKLSQQPQSIDYRPLAAWIDSMTGSKLYQSAQDMAAEQAAQRLEMMKQESYAENRLAQDKRAREALLARLSGTPMQRGRLGIAEDRLAAQAADKFDNDRLILRNEQQRQQIDLDKHTLDTATILTPQIFDEIQIGIANAISGGRTAAVATQNKVEFDSINKQWTKLQQRVSNKPEDIGSPEVRKMLSDTMGRLAEAYQNNSYARAKQIRKGRDLAYKNNPGVIQLMDEKVESYNPKARFAHPPSRDDLETMTDEELEAEFMRSQSAGGQ